MSQSDLLLKHEAVAPFIAAIKSSIFTHFRLSIESITAEALLCLMSIPTLRYLKLRMSKYGPRRLKLKDIKLMLATFETRFRHLINKPVDGDDDCKTDFVICNARVLVFCIQRM